MVFPTANEVEAFDKFMFCDDLSESYSTKLASCEQLAFLDNYSILKRGYHKIFSHLESKNVEILFWPYGTAAFAGKFSSKWYRWNIIIWEILRYYKQKVG